MKPITYRQAAKILELPDDKVGTVRNAAMRGTLTKYPSLSQEQLVIEEQVMLFKGKKQIRETMLSDTEKTIWLKYKKEVELLQETNIDPFDFSEFRTLYTSLKGQDAMYNEMSKLAFSRAIDTRKGGEEERDKLEKTIERFQIKTENPPEDMESTLIYIDEQINYTFLLMVKIMVEREDCRELLRRTEQSIIALSKLIESTEGLEKEAIQIEEHLEYTRQLLLLKERVIQEKIDTVFSKGMSNATKSALSL